MIFFNKKKFDIKIKVNKKGKQNKIKYALGI